MNHSDFRNTFGEQIRRNKEKKSPNFEFRNGDLTKIPKELSEQCFWIRTLDLSYNMLRELPDHLTLLNSLSELRLKQNLISKIPQWFFQSFTQLVSLDLSFNRLTEINAEFGLMTQLQSLLLNNNQILHISDIFSELTSLTSMSTLV
jgi:Leucine-rich repeat (LRR) protein